MGRCDGYRPEWKNGKDAGERKTVEAEIMGEEIDISYRVYYCDTLCRPISLKL